MTSQTESLLVTSEMLHTRLDRLLVQSFPHHSRTYFQYLIGSGLVLVNGSPVKKREMVEVGDEIDVCFELTPELSLEAENIPLDILFEDEFLIAINKPAGMVTHPAPGHPNGTFVNALLYHCKTLPTIEQQLRPGIVHRLDKDTSGVLIAAKTTECHQKLVEMFSSRSVTKHYLAICLGNPGDRTIEEPIRRHPTRRQEMHVDSAGKPATSICRVLETEGDLSWVDVQLITGRTHQIRVHLKHVGTPILGDPVYGRPAANEKYGVQRQLLHAKTLSLIHPMTGAPLNFEAPIPADFIAPRIQ
jgi:23S rRNA pseudouridine1911/1915/1917 synthase